MHDYSGDHHLHMASSEDISGTSSRDVGGIGWVPAALERAGVGRTRQAGRACAGAAAVGGQFYLLRQAGGLIAGKALQPPMRPWRNS